MIRFGRGQNARGFIEDQDIGLPIQRLQDLDPLLVTDREFVDRLIGIDLQFVFLGQFAQPGAGAGQRGPQHRPVLGPEDDVLQNGEVPHQLEMLEDHADPGTDRGHGIGDLDGRSVDSDLARIGLVETVKDRHQRRFPGPVFPDDAMDRAPGDGQVDVLVGLNRAECLGNPAKLDGRGHILGGRSRPPGLGSFRRHQSAGQVLSVM